MSAPIASKRGVAIHPGYELRNGAIVIAASTRNAHEWVILAMRPDYTYDRYVTWKASRPGDGSDTYSGHYFENLLDAVLDYNGRP